MLQSQSKLLGHLTVFPLSQCWTKGLANLTAINNIGREGRTAKREKKRFRVEVSQLFLSKIVPS